MAGAVVGNARILPEVRLTAGSLLIGDLHLDVGPGSSGGEGFARWLEALDRVPRLVILGDLFEAWIGPAQASLPAAARVLAAIAARVARGTAVDVVPGNRDFLLGRGFELLSGAELRPEGMVARLPGGERALLLHGDELCTLDRGYQRLRRVLRSRPVLAAAPRVPRPAALWVARRLRRASVRAVAAKPAAEKEQQVSAVRELAARHGCGMLACGHAHAFRDERLEGGPRWIVVGAFGGERDVLRVRGDGDIEAVSSAAIAAGGGG